MISFKEFIKKEIQLKGSIDYREMLALCEGWGEDGKKIKPSTAERRLRELRNITEIKAFDKEGREIISGRTIDSYRWVGSPLKFKEYFVEGRCVLRQPIFE